MIDLLALDVDGTLIDDTLTIPDRVQGTILEVQERDVTVTLATGRMLESTIPFARQLGIDAPLICYQGGLIQAPTAETPLYRATMDRDILRDALAWRTEQGWHVVLYADDALFISEWRYPKSFYRELLGENLYTVDDLAAVLEHHEPVKFLFIADPPEADQIERAMRQRFRGQMEIVRSHANFVEANPLGVSKGDALRRLADHLGIPQAGVMAIGDQGNDVPMLEWAGLGVAMGNASPEAKAAADWIAPPFSEYGAAVAIERFILDA